MRQGIFLRTQDIALLQDISMAEASRERRRLEAILNKPRKGKITIREYAEAERINENEVREALAMPLK